MSALQDPLENEPQPIVRAVLGHWLFGFIHPYMDGNGRNGAVRYEPDDDFGRVSWTIVRTSRRKDYLDAPEAASADHNIVPCARFIREEMSVDWTNQATSPRSTGSGNGLA